MKKKDYWGKKFKRESIYPAYKYFLEKSGINENTAHKYFSITIKDLTSDCKDSTEFFAKVGQVDEFHIVIRKDDFEFNIVKVSELATVLVTLPNDSDINKILGFFDDVGLSQNDQIEKTI